MCGIAGFVNFRGQAREDAAVLVKRMTDTLVHRGPDAEGFYIDDCAALGHRRLSIIDLSGGQQPMGALDGRLQIVFNGEIYNYLAVRTDLEDRGYRFHTRSDTEVILLAYAEWGERCVEWLSGMFAFALWDARERCLFLARDRVGKKPLYYWRGESTLVFASELKALRASGFCPSAVDLESLDCYLSFGYVPAPRTIYRNIKKLRAAHTIAVSALSERERRYWTLNFADPKAVSLEEATDEFESLLDEAVRCRLMSEVPLGAFLSGGIDSSLVVSSMAKLTQRPVVTNSIGFEDREFSELPVAGAIAKHLGTDQREFVVTARAADVIEKIAWHFDEPMADSSAVPTWYVCEMARRSVTVSLSGDGGDEAFGGYTFRYVPHAVESRIRDALPMAVRAPLFGTIGAAWPASARLPKPLRLKTIFENLAVADSEAFYRDLTWLRPDARRALYRAEFVADLRGFSPMEIVAAHYARNTAPDALGRSQYTDIQLYMTDDVLVKVDRMSMAHSLEVRCPLLDHRILEFAARLPSARKMTGRIGKLPLRRLAARRLPAAISRLPKRGFAIPAGRWLRTELRPIAESLLFGGNGLIAETLDRTMLRNMWQEHQSGSRDHQVFIWGLMMLGLWDQQRSASSNVRPG